MTSTSTPIVQHPDAAGIYYSSNQVLLGDHIATYDDDADETTGYPCVLPDGDTVDGDQDRDELRGALRALGYDTETDDEGLVLVLVRA